MPSVPADGEKRRGWFNGTLRTRRLTAGLYVLRFPAPAVIDGADLLLQADSSPVPVLSLSV